MCGCGRLPFFHNCPTSDTGQGMRTLARNAKKNAPLQPGWSPICHQSPRSFRINYCGVHNPRSKRDWSGRQHRKKGTVRILRKRNVTITRTLASLRWSLVCGAAFGLADSGCRELHEIQQVHTESETRLTTRASPFRFRPALLVFQGRNPQAACFDFSRFVDNTGNDFAGAEYRKWDEDRLLVDDRFPVIGNSARNAREISWKIDWFTSGKGYLQCQCLQGLFLGGQNRE